MGKLTEPQPRQNTGNHPDPLADMGLGAAPMRHLTVEECAGFDVEGGQNEVTPVIEDGKVIAVYIYTTHASGWRERRLIPYGHRTYGKLVEAAGRSTLTGEWLGAWES